MDTNLTSIVEDRWREAVAEPSIPRWQSLADWASDMASAINASDPDNIMVATHRGVAAECEKRIRKMMPKAVAA